MKNLTKLSIIAATATVIGTSVSFADDPQLQTRLALQRQQAERSQTDSTIAVYARDRGVGQRMTTSGSDRTEDRTVVLHKGRGQVERIDSSKR